MLESPSPHSLALTTRRVGLELEIAERNGWEDSTRVRRVWGTHNSRCKYVSVYCIIRCSRERGESCAERVSAFTSLLWRAALPLRVTSWNSSMVSTGNLEQSEVRPHPPRAEQSLAEASALIPLPLSPLSSLRLLLLRSFSCSRSDLSLIPLACVSRYCARVGGEGKLHSVGVRFAISQGSSKGVNDGSSQ